jgi:hypothetical protein
MVDLDTSCKIMGWNGHDSLQWEKIIHISCRKTHIDELYKSWLWWIAKKVHYIELNKSIMSCNPKFNPMSRWTPTNDNNVCFHEWQQTSNELQQNLF